MRRLIPPRTKLPVHELELMFEKAEAGLLKLADARGFPRLTADLLHYIVDLLVWKQCCKPPLESKGHARHRSRA
jgi:hypothetical protein